MPRILSITSSRADIGILMPVWQALAAESSVTLHVLETGMHCQGASPFSLPDGVIRHIAGQDIGGQHAAQAAHGMAMIMDGCVDILERHHFDLLLVAGDRLDMFPVLVAALPFNLPIAHLHGGELTYGAIDDRVRHAASKLAHLHFVSHPGAARRLASMGEESWRIHICGAPGLDTLRAAPEIPAAEFASAVGLERGEGFLLVTVHPETNADDPVAPMRALAAALQKIQIPVLISAPNSDPAGRSIHTMAKVLTKDRPQTVFVDTLGRDLYPSAIRLAAAVVGNSSSGMIEAAFFGTPALNIGARQAGRESDPSVRHVPSDATAITMGLREILAGPRGESGRTAYGDGFAAQRIAAALRNLPAPARLLAKRFSTAPAVAFDTPWQTPRHA